MWTMFLRNRLLLSQPFQDFIEGLNFLGIISEPLVVFFLLRRWLQFFHNPIDFSIASSDDRSSAASLRNMPLSTSAIAARVVALGS